MARGIENDDRGFDVGRGIDDASEGLDIWERWQKLWRCNEGPNELATTKETSEEEDDTEVLTTTTDASAEEA